MTTEQWYACEGVTENGGRCRNRDGRCPSQHKQKVGIPDAVFLRIRVNPTWSKRLQDAGVQLNTIDWAKGDARRARQARRVRRDPHAYRKDASDGGVQVFGKSGIDGAVSVRTLLREVKDAGLHFTDAHLERREDRRTDTLVLVLSGEGESLAIIPEIQQLLDSTWKTVQPWANPRNEDGKVVSTVNIGHRLPDVDPVTVLAFAGGAWRTVAP